MTSPVSLHFERPRQKGLLEVRGAFLGHRHPWALLISVGVYCQTLVLRAMAEGLWSYRHRSGSSPAAAVAGAVTPRTQPRPGPHTGRVPCLPALLPGCSHPPGISEPGTLWATHPLPSPLTGMDKSSWGWFPEEGSSVPVPVLWQEYRGKEHA